MKLESTLGALVRASDLTVKSRSVTIGTLVRTEHSHFLLTTLHFLFCLVTDEEFNEFFSQFGTVVDSTVMFDRETRRSRGFGFVTYEDPVRCFYADYVWSHILVLTSYKFLTTSCTECCSSTPGNESGRDGWKGKSFHAWQGVRD